MSIFIIAVIVIGVAIVIWLIRLLMHGRRLMSSTPVKDIKYLLDRERCFEDEDDYPAKTFPPGE